VTTVLDVVRAAIPTADEALADHVLWGRTPYPCGPTSARAIYRAASALRRAGARGVALCEFCHRIARPGEWECESCDAALRHAARHRDDDVPTN
jgi:hypothetical protein